MLTQTRGVHSRHFDNCISVFSYSSQHQKILPCHQTQVWELNYHKTTTLLADADVRPHIKLSSLGSPSDSSMAVDSTWSHLIPTDCHHYKSERPPSLTFSL
ncbi:hypothetical protein RJT34_14290 [Clitoria ternatea]|uniref:Uncharacterized protein n=1 Tax=Clitoria ternatea TaxID=43366 RepID=A0AAN9JS79_CLITE